ncbi:hypothetical protein BGZ54_005461 [Gamsiella multidivaricata]|nr:hypothetical protein BGZ54_005461 [Gamsiella multidivaricata]
MARKEKGLLGSDVDVEIQGEVSAVENFLALNRISPNPRRIIPITSSRQPFVSFTERNLVGFFFSRGGVLRAQVQELVGTICTSIADAQEHIGNMEPGILIKKFLADIGLKGLTSRQRRKAGHRGAIELLNLEELETDLHMLDSKDFRPETYLTKNAESFCQSSGNGFLKIDCHDD